MIDEVMPPIRVFLLSVEPRIQFNGIDVPLNARRDSLHLFIYASDQGQPEYEREKLAITVLGETSKSRRFRDALSIMNKIFGEAGLHEKILQGETKLEFQRSQVWVDAHEFATRVRKLVRSTNQLINPTFIQEAEQALDLYKSHFLQEHAFESIDELLSWQEKRQAELVMLYHELLDELIQFHLHQGTTAQAQNYAKIWLDSLEPGFRPLEYLIWIACKHRRYANAHRYLFMLQDWVEVNPPFRGEYITKWRSLIETKEEPSLNILGVRTTNYDLQSDAVEPIIERESHLNYLIKLLTSSHSPQVVGLIGLPGVGKTFFAQQIVKALNQAELHFEVAWIELSLNLDFELLLNEVLSQFRLEQLIPLPYTTKQKRFKQVIQGSRCLVVIDEGTSNRLADHQFIERLVPLFEGIQLLLIARRIPDFEHFPFQLPGFDADHVEQFFAQQIPKLREIDTSIISGATAITGGLPLVLNWIVGFVNQRRFQLITFVNHLTKLQITPWNSENAPTYYEYILDWLWQELSLDEKTILYTVSIFDPSQGVTIEDVASIANSAFVLRIEQLQQKLNRLLDLRLLHQHARSTQIYVLHPVTYDYLRQERRQTKQEFDVTQIKRAYVNHFLAFTSRNQHDFSRLDQQKNNILLMFEIALLQNNYPELWIEVVGTLNTLYNYFDRYGLHAILETFLTKGLESNKTSDLERVRLLHHLGQVRFKQWQLDEAEELLKDAWKLAQQIELVEAYSLILRDLGRIYLQRGIYDKAIEYMKRGETLSEQQQQWAVNGQLTANLGVIAERQGQNSIAQEHFERIISMLEKQESEVKRTFDYLDLSQFARLGLGRIATEYKQYREAEIHLRESLDIARTLNNSERIAWVYLNLGVVNYHRSDFEAALEYFTQGSIVAESIQHNELLVWFGWNKGALYVVFGNYKLAKKMLQTALNDAIRLGLTVVMPYIFIWLGLSHFCQTQMTLARRYFTEVFDQQTLNTRFAALALFGLSLVTRFENDLSMKDNFASAYEQITSALEHEQSVQKKLAEIKITSEHLEDAQGYFQIALVNDMPGLQGFRIVEVLSKWLAQTN